MFNETAIDSSSRPPCTEGDALPQVFCWTKMGTEAGQGLDAILQRKEFERQSGDGLFAWGIGNSVGPAVRYARELGFDSLDVLFTRMKSAPKAIDVSPSALVLWTSYEGENGEVLPLPAHVLVTSRASNDGRAVLKRTHYALLCKSTRSLLSAVDEQAVDSSAVCNLVSRNPTGASQVTAVVRTTASQAPRKPYPVQFRAKLVGPGFVRLVRPTLLTADLLRLYRHAIASASVEHWRDRAEELRSAVAGHCAAPAVQRSLFN